MARRHHITLGVTPTCPTPTSRRPLLATRSLQGRWGKDTIGCTRHGAVGVGEALLRGASRRASHRKGRLSTARQAGAAPLPPSHHAVRSSVPGVDPDLVMNEPGRESSL